MKVVIAVTLGLVVVIALVAGLRRGGKENAGLWSGTCPATESELMKEVSTCFEAEKGKSLAQGKNCGRAVVAKRTGGNDHYKLGDTLNDCYLCGQFILSGLYPAEKGASQCVSSRWMESDEFKKIQNVFYPGSR